jgi:TatA/E family protein of Tat protein translocase
MFGSIGAPELIIILVIALIIFGPRKLPELGRSLGKSIGEFKKASNELRSTLEEEIRVDEERERRVKAEEDRQRTARAEEERAKAATPVATASPGSAAEPEETVSRSSSTGTGA